MERARILIVANSRKLGARCLAGVDLDEQRLMRPVSPNGSGALSDEECRVDGHTPALLEVVTFAHTGSPADPAQPENVVIGASGWQTEGTLDEQEALDVLLGMCEEGSKLFGNHGRAVPEYVAAEGMESSLALLAPEKLDFGHELDVDAPREARGHSSSSADKTGTCRLPSSRLAPESCS